MMNHDALKLLEFPTILEHVASFSLTEEAKNRILSIRPSTDHEVIYEKLNETSEAAAILNQKQSVPLLGINGIGILLDKIDKEMILAPDELEKIKHLLINTKKIKQFMLEASLLAPVISQYAYSMYELDFLRDEIHRCIRNSQVDDKASKQLESIRKQKYIAQGRIKSKLDSMSKQGSLKNFLQDTTVTIKNNRFVLQVKAAYRNEIPGTIIDKSATGSTLFIEPAIISRYQEELTQLELDEENEIYQVLSFLTSTIKDYIKELRITLDTCINYDFIFSKGKYSQVIGGNTVSLNTSHYIKLIDARHPLIGKEAVPLNFEIGSTYKALVITGPNTGGKTVALKTVGLLTAMVQSGIHVPVGNGSQFAIFGDILVDIGDGQSIEQSLSTFSSHIKKIIQIMQQANKYTLVILDEIGSGTDPIEGEGLAIAILKRLAEKNATILATSHYGKVKEFASHQDGFTNGKMHFDLDTLKPTYQLTIGEAGESNAFIIALKLGMDVSVINMAHEASYNEPKDYASLSTTLINNSSPKIKKPKTISSNRQQPSGVRVGTGELDIVPPATQQENRPQLPYEFKKGDQVYIKTMDAKGIIYEEANHKDEVSVMIGKLKVSIHKRKVTLLIEAGKLYPENYDFDIVFKSKAYRKHDHLLKRKYVKDQVFNIEDV